MPRSTPDWNARVDSIIRVGDPEQVRQGYDAWAPNYNEDYQSMDGILHGWRMAGHPFAPRRRNLRACGEFRAANARSEEFRGTGELNAAFGCKTGAAFAPS